MSVLLQQEMNTIETAMRDILMANASGVTQTGEGLAESIKDSFILNKQLTSSQKHQRHALLPEDFIQQVQRFHSHAGMLEHAAKNKKSN